MEEVKCWFDRCVECYNEGKYEEGIVWAKRSLTIYQENGDQEGIANCYFLLGRCYQQLKKYSEAIDYYKQCLAIYQENEDQEKIANCFMSLGGCYQQLKKYSEAIDYYEQCLAIYQENEDQEKIVNCFMSLGGCYKQLKKYSEAIDYIKQGLAIYQKNEDQEGIANCFMSLGGCYQQLKKYSEAIDYYKQCLSYFKKQNNQLIIADCYELLSFCYKKRYSYFEAINNYNQCLDIHQKTKNHEGIARCNKGLGDCYYNLYNYSEALSKHKQSLSTITNNNLGKQLEGVVYVDIGADLISMKRYEDSKQYLDKALIIADEIEDRKLKSLCNCRLSNLSVILREFEKAEDYAYRALSIANEIDDTEEKQEAYFALSLTRLNGGKAKEAIYYHKLYIQCNEENIEDKNNQSRALCSLSSCYLRIHDYDSAIRFGEESLKMAKENDDLTTQYEAFHNIGLALQTKGKFRESIEYYNKCLQCAVLLKDKGREARANNNLGTAYMDLCKHYKAIDHLQTSLKLYSELDIVAFNCATYNNLGVLYGEIGNYQEAAKYFEKYLSLVEETSYSAAAAYHNLSAAYFNINKFRLAGECRLKSIIIDIRQEGERGKIWYFQELGVTFRENKQLYKAMFYHNKALKAAQAIRNSKLIAECYMRLAETCNYCGRIVETLNFYEKALTTFAESENIRGKAECCYKIACVYRQETTIENSIQKAEKYFCKALQYYEEIFVDLREKHDLKITMVDTYIKAYKALALLFIETGRPSEALLVCDRGRACTLRDTMVSRYDMQHNQVLVEHLEEEDLQDFLSSERSLLFLAILDNNIHSWVLSRKHSLLHKQHGINQDQDSITQNVTQYIRQLIAAAHTSMNVRQMKANECEDRSLGTNETLCQEDGRLQQLTSCMTNMQLENDYDGIEEESTDISRNPPDSTLSKPQEYPDIKEPLQELFKLLIAPIKEHLKEDEVVIVLEGPLYMVPFAALQDPQTRRYFCESKQIRIMPSLKTLRILKQCPSDYHSIKGALVVGNPCVGEVIIRGKKRKLSSLLAAENEAVIFAGLLHVKPLTGSSATKDAVKEKLKEGAAIIHIAAHGDSTTGEIALAPGVSAQTKSIADEEDSILTMQEVQEIGVRAKLVVLSCCQTGRGEIRAEGVIGMARAFLAAGARAVVASLWNIKDKATLDFMVGFYNHLIRKGKSASKSLNESMKDLILEEKYSHPKYWAPFVLIGDDVTINIKDGGDDNKVDVDNKVDNDDVNDDGAKKEAYDDDSDTDSDNESDVDMDDDIDDDYDSDDIVSYEPKCKLPRHQ